MRLPNHKQAYIADSKVCDYLLSDSHPIGKAKAAWFFSLGYSMRDWEKLKADLLELATGDAELLDDSTYGQKYGIRGILLGPNGKSGSVMTIWITLKGNTYPSFVTAYPDE